MKVFTFAHQSDPDKTVKTAHPKLAPLAAKFRLHADRQRKQKAEKGEGGKGLNVAKIPAFVAEVEKYKLAYTEDMSDAEGAKAIVEGGLELPDLGHNDDGRAK